MTATACLVMKAMVMTANESPVAMIIIVKHQLLSIAHRSRAVMIVPKTVTATKESAFVIPASLETDGIAK